VLPATLTAGKSYAGVTTYYQQINQQLLDEFLAA
jgi:hypothetical protein